jgi:hypothetical protein
MSKRSESYRSKGEVECGLRTVEGNQEGLSSKWSHGVAAIEPNRLNFRGTVGGVRFLRRTPVQLDVTGVDRSEQRTPAGKEILALNPGARVFTLTTSTATLECAVANTDVRWLLESLAL